MRPFVTFNFREIQMRADNTNQNRLINYHFSEEWALIEHQSAKLLVDTRLLGDIAHVVGRLYQVLGELETLEVRLIINHELLKERRAYFLKIPQDKRGKCSQSLAAPKHPKVHSARSDHSKCGRSRRQSLQRGSQKEKGCSASRRIILSVTQLSRNQHLHNIILRHTIKLHKSVSFSLFSSFSYCAHHISIQLLVF